MDDIQALKNEIAELRKENESLKASAISSTSSHQEEYDYNESEMRFRTVFECSRLGNKIISSDLVIIQINPAMVAMLGYENKQEILGTKIADYTPSEFKGSWKILQENLWKNATPSFSLDTCLIKKDGSIIDCRVTSILFQDKGETFGYTIIEDITEQQKLRRQKEDFITVASHELKTPITILKATLQLINRLIKKEATVSEMLVQLVKNAEINSVKLGNLVVNLLDATKLDQSQLSLNKSEVKLTELVTKCCTHIMLERKHRVIQTGDLSLRVHADEEKIGQVLTNLVNNAIKYAPYSKQITVHIEKQQDEVKVSVIDNGPGIDIENVSKIFERYFRVDENKNQNSGLGLGLYISSEIIRRHGGEIGVESEIGRGSRFWFTIPMELSTCETSESYDTKVEN